MEGTFFFGEHLRWNLGWSNPNQGGVFVAMWIPWLWGLGLCFAGGSARGTRAMAVAVLACELGLWFLLCKTYSRGALVAVVAGGAFFVLASCLRGSCGVVARMAAVRVAAVGALLFLTGFFGRIDPGFVVQDASAGNRLVLWKGGLRMMAVSPWNGWGAGKSGSGFMHWFQPLEAEEAYAGMVNSFLHVGVERGVVVLAGVLTVALAVMAFSWLSVRGQGVGCDGVAGGWREGLGYFQYSAGGSLLVFFVANVFSTLWIFGNLWWLPMGAGLWIVGAGAVLCGRRFFKAAGACLGLGLAGAASLTVGVWLAGAWLTPDVRISVEPDGGVMCCAAGAGGQEEVLFFPDRTVLGETWGKEVRRLALHDRELRIHVQVDWRVDGWGGRGGPRRIIACGWRAEDGFAALSRFPGAHLVLVHPLGKPMLPDEMAGRISVIVPALDTTGGGRRWRAFCKRRKWECLTSPGVGQDVRLVWPRVLDGVR